MFRLLPSDIVGSQNDDRKTWTLRLVVVVAFLAFQFFATFQASRSAAVEQADEQASADSRRLCGMLNENRNTLRTVIERAFAEMPVDASGLDPATQAYIREANLRREQLRGDLLRDVEPINCDLFSFER